MGGGTWKVEVDEPVLELGEDILLPVRVNQLETFDLANMFRSAATSTSYFFLLSVHTSVVITASSCCCIVLFISLPIFFYNRLHF